MYLCLCKGVPERHVDLAIARGCTTPRDVAACTGAGTGCGICVDEVRRKLREVRITSARVAPEEEAISAK